MITEHRTSSGFTLVEILLAIMIASMAMVAVSGTFISTLRARDEVETLANSTEIFDVVTSKILDGFAAVISYIFAHCARSLVFL